MSAADIFDGWKKEFGAFAALGEAWNEAGELTLKFRGGDAVLAFGSTQIGHVAASST